MGSCSSSLSSIKNTDKPTTATKKGRTSDEFYIYNMLLYGPPESGKTTLFRQLARYGYDSVPTLNEKEW
jgi:replication-associated recombination protein RarA